MRLRLRHFWFAWVCAAALGLGGACGSVASRNDAGTGGASGSVGGASGSAGGAGGNPADDGGQTDGGSTPTILYRGGIEAVGPITAPAGATIRIINAGLRYPRARTCNASTCLSGGIIP